MYTRKNKIRSYLPLVPTSFKLNQKVPELNIQLEKKTTTKNSRKIFYFTRLFV